MSDPEGVGGEHRIAEAARDEHQTIRGNRLHRDETKKREPSMDNSLHERPNSVD
jgi:hypothetical protein